MFILISVQIMVWVYLYVITCSLGGVNQLKMQYMWVQRSHMTPNWGPCYIVGCTLYQVKRPFIVHIHLSGSTDAILKVACNCACLESVQEYYCCVFFYSFFLCIYVCTFFGCIYACRSTMTEQFMWIIQFITLWNDYWWWWCLIKWNVNVHFQWNCVDNEPQPNRRHFVFDFDKKIYYTYVDKLK